MTDFQDRLAALRQQFRARCLTTREELKSALDADDRGSIGQVAHSLAGSGGIFGFDQLSQAAELLEHEAQAVNGNSDAVLKLGTAVLDELDDVVRSGP